MNARTTRSSRRARARIVSPWWAGDGARPRHGPGWDVSIGTVLSEEKSTSLPVFNGFDDADIVIAPEFPTSPWLMYRHIIPLFACVCLTLAACATRSAAQQPVAAPTQPASGTATILDPQVPPGETGKSPQGSGPGVHRPQVRVLSADQRPPQVELNVARQVDSVRHAQAEGHMERVAVNGRPTPFSRERYVTDPDSYLHVIEPCRIWQQADPGPDVDVLSTPEGAQGALIMVHPGVTSPLIVLTWPGYPATFTSMDRGVFHNGLTSITVQADADGLATAQFTATAGTTDTVHILAASPVTSGNVNFTITIPDSK